VNKQFQGGWTKDFATPLARPGKERNISSTEKCSKKNTEKKKESRGKGGQPGNSIFARVVKIRKMIMQSRGDQRQT